MTVFAEVVFPLPISKSFVYRIPEAFENRIQAGCRILAPLGRKVTAGFVISLSTSRPSGRFEIKDIRDILEDVPPFSKAFLSFTRKLSSSLQSSWGEILEAALPPTLVPKDQKRLSLTSSGREALAAKSLLKKESQLASILQARPYSRTFLTKKMGSRNLSSLISRMEAKGFIRVQTRRPHSKEKVLAAETKDARQLAFDFTEPREPGPIAALERKIQAGVAASFYLFGSHSARQAAYDRLIRLALRVGGRVLFLLPEISLSETVLERLKFGMGEAAAILHSRLSGRMREEGWRNLVEKRTDVGIGSRSALFVPLSDLRLIIVDEESDESFAAQEGPLYDTRKGARLRAFEEGGVVVYGSSWPSVELYHESLMEGSLIALDKETWKFRTSIVDDRGEKILLTGVLKEKIRHRIHRGDPVILFLNKRGYAPSVFCPKCAYLPKCRRCDVALSYHKKNNALTCHYCGFTLPASQKCPECGTMFGLRKAKGIEALEEELKAAFPDISAASYDSDTPGGDKNRGKMLDDFRRGRLSILLGTQLLAHRGDVPKVPFVGILSPEDLLGLSDYRASQRVSRTIIQMRSFAENDERSEVVIQTSCPSHFAIQTAAAGDYPSFFEAEIESRRLMNYPPFAHLAEVLFRGSNLRSLGRASRDFAAHLKSFQSEIEVLGPALAPLPRRRGLHQIMIILKTKEQGRETLDRVLRDTQEKSPGRRSVRILW